MVSGWCWVCNIKLPFKTKSVGICQGERRIRAELGGEERLVEGNCGDYYCFLFYSTTWVSIEVVNNEHENYRQITYNENMQDWLSNLFNIQIRMQFKENEPCSNKFLRVRWSTQKPEKFKMSYTLCCYEEPNILFLWYNAIWL